MKNTFERRYASLVNRFLKEMDFDQINMKWTADTWMLIGSLNEKWEKVCKKHKKMPHQYDLTKYIFAIEVQNILIHKYRCTICMDDIDRYSLMHPSFGSHMMAGYLYHNANIEII